MQELRRIPDARIDFQNFDGASEGRDITLYPDRRQPAAGAKPPRRKS